MNSAKRNQAGQDVVPGSEPVDASDENHAGPAREPYAGASSIRRFVSHSAKWNLLHQQSRAKFCEDRFQISHRVAGRLIPARKSRGSRLRKLSSRNVPS
jgi:hypothetical protein